MKNLKILFIVILLISCDQNSSDKPEHYANISKTGKIMAGEHALRKILITECDTESHKYFVIGKLRNSFHDIPVTFNWQLNTGEFIITTLPFSKIRINIDDKAFEPYIKFKWLHSSNTNIITILEENLVYVEITCREEDYPLVIKL